VGGSRLGGPGGAGYHGAARGSFPPGPGQGNRQGGAARDLRLGHLRLGQLGVHPHRGHGRAAGPISPEWSCRPAEPLVLRPAGCGPRCSGGSRTACAAIIVFLAAPELAWRGRPLRRLERILAAILLAGRPRPWASVLPGPSDWRSTPGLYVAGQVALQLRQTSSTTPSCPRSRRPRRSTGLGPGLRLGLIGARCSSRGACPSTSATPLRPDPGGVSRPGAWGSPGCGGQVRRQPR
jgi:hypothetical protein